MWIIQLSISKAGYCRIGTNEYIVCILQIAAEPKKTQTYSLQNQNLLIFSYFLIYNLSYFASHAKFSHSHSSLPKAAMPNWCPVPEGPGTGLLNFEFLFLFLAFFICLCLLGHSYLGRSVCNRQGRCYVGVLLERNEGGPRGRTWLGQK